MWLILLWRNRPAHHMMCVLALSAYLEHYIECAPVRIRKTMKTPCDADEFYDTVVDQCARCSDVCRPKMMPMDFCRNNCPDFYFRLMGNTAVIRTSTSRRVGITASTVVSTPRVQLPVPQQLSTVDSSYNYLAAAQKLEQSPVQNDQAPNSSNEANAASEEKSASSELLYNPLVWVSVAALTISVIATSAIVVVVMRRRRKSDSADVTNSTPATTMSSNSTNSAEVCQLLSTDNSTRPPDGSKPSSLMSTSENL